MVSFKVKKRNDTKSLLIPRRPGLQKRGGGFLLRSDDYDDDTGFDFRRRQANRGSGAASHNDKHGAMDPSGTPPRSDATPPLSPESDDDDEFGPPLRSRQRHPISPSQFLQLDVASMAASSSSAASQDPPGIKMVAPTDGTAGGGSLVQNLLCMMDKACVAPMEGEWGGDGDGGGGGGERSGGDSRGGEAETEDDGEEDDGMVERPEERATYSASCLRPFDETPVSLHRNSRFQHYLEPQKGEKHESFEMILREKTPPRKKKKLGIKSLLHLPALPSLGGGGSSGAGGGAPSDLRKPSDRKVRSRSASPKARNRRSGQHGDHRPRNRLDNEGRVHKPLTAVSDPIPVSDEEKKEDERYSLRPPRVNPRHQQPFLSQSLPPPATTAMIPKTITASAPPITRHFAKEARYKQVLGSWMSSRTPLETIREDELRSIPSGEAAGAATGGAAPSGGGAATSVRVPGIKNPDKFLSHSDMIGEVVQSRASSPEKGKASRTRVAAATDGTTAAVEGAPAETANSSTIKKSRTWVGKFLRGLGLDGEDDDVDPAVSLARQRSAPENLSQEPSALVETPDASDSAKQRLWKAVTCAESNRTYYYHRLTRRTTWTKPPDDELILPGATVKNTVEEEDEIKKVHLPVLAKETKDLVLAKQDIAASLRGMGHGQRSVGKILTKYKGREKEFLDRLRTASQEQPFDGLRATAEDQPFDEITSRPGYDGASLMASATVEHSTFAGSSAMSRSLQNQSRQSSYISGFSSALMSASTQPIRNTGIGRIFSTPVASTDVQSHATSISSKLGYMLPPAKADPPPSQEALTRVPSNIPVPTVPRARELLVEEFNYNRESKRNKGVIRQSPAEPVAVEPSPAYFGDNDDTDTKETDTVSPNDSISALSEADMSFTNNQEAKRHALDEAIANEDWDLAALLSESLRSAPVKAPAKKREWTQTELDRYISSNDWDAVGNYIAKLRSGSNGAHAQPAKSKRLVFGPQKRFGAKSQLQHKKLAARRGSWEESESYSSFESEYSSSSSDTYEEIMKARKQSDKFAC